MNNIINKIDTIRYMGNKKKLLEYIVEAVDKVTIPGGTVLDIMSGSNSVGYGLKNKYRIISNDIQLYSKVISDALIVNQSETISDLSAEEDLSKNYYINLKDKKFNFFEKEYSDTYFSKLQCIDIDSIRYSIEFIENKFKKSLYLVALMSAMSTCQSTPGHFAQFMPKNHKRIIPLQKMNLHKEFLKKCNNYSELVFSSYNNLSFNLDFNELLDIQDLNIDTVYLDSPYTTEQYSRFYHILETIVKYDNPVVEHKAKYRNDRFKSNFCYKSLVEKEFRKIFEFCMSNNINLVLSYSNKGVLQAEILISILKDYFKNVEYQYISYNHSTQGKGNLPLNELLIANSN